MTQTHLPLKSWELPGLDSDPAIGSFGERYPNMLNDLEDLPLFQSFPPENQRQIQRDVRLSIFKTVLKGPCSDWYAEVGEDPVDEDIVLANSCRYEGERWDCHSFAYFQNWQRTEHFYVLLDASTPGTGATQWFPEFDASIVGEAVAAEAAEAFYSVNKFRISSQYLQRFLNEGSETWAVKNFITRLDIVVQKRTFRTPEIDFLAQCAVLADLPHLTEVAFILQDNEPRALTEITEIIIALENRGITRLSIHGRQPFSSTAPGEEEETPTPPAQILHDHLAKTGTMRILRQYQAPVNLAVNNNYNDRLQFSVVWSNAQACILPHTPGPLVLHRSVLGTEGVYYRY